MRLLFVAGHTTDDAMLVDLLKERLTLNLNQHSVDSGAAPASIISIATSLEGFANRRNQTLQSYAG